MARAFRAKGAAPALWHRHQDSEKEGVTLRLAMSLTKGGGFDVAPSSMGHDATTLMRDVLQAHLLTYDFYTTGAPAHRTRPLGPRRSLLLSAIRGPELKSLTPRPSASPCRAGRTPFSHRGSPRKGDGVTLVLTLRDCTLAEAVAILKEMGISVTVAA